MKIYVTYSKSNDKFPRVSINLKGTDANVEFLHTDDGKIILQTEIDSISEEDNSSSSAGSILKISLIPLSLLLWVASFQKKIGFFMCLTVLIFAVFSGYSIAQSENDTLRYEVNIISFLLYKNKIINS